MFDKLPHIKQKWCFSERNIQDDFAVDTIATSIISFTKLCLIVSLFLSISYFMFIHVGRKLTGQHKYVKYYLVFFHSRRRISELQ